MDGTRLRRPDGVGPRIDLERIRSTVGAARARGRTVLLETEGRAVLRALGIAVPRALVATDALAAGSLDLSTLRGDRVVVKVVAPGLQHKSDVGGVAIVPRTPTAVREAAAAMERRLDDGSIEGFLVVEHVDHDASPGGELLLAARWTDDVGPIVSIGLGGIHAEALAADLRPGRELAIVSPRLTPPGAIEGIVAASTIGRLATRPRRGRPPRIAPAALADLVERLEALAVGCLPADLTELEINPLVATANGPVALDVLATLGDPPPPRPAARPLHKLRRLLEPASVAIVGVSSGENPGHIILRNLLRDGFDPGRIQVVKPGIERIDGCACVPDLATLDGPVDLFVVAVSAAQVPAIVSEAIERDIAETLIVIPGGLEEKAGGETLLARPRASLAAARRRPGGGPLINGANCLGIRSRPGHIDTMFIPETKLPHPAGPPAPLAIVAQSGAFAISRLSRLEALDPVFTITVGNQTDLTIGDHLTSLRGDPRVEIIAVYVEGFAPLDGLSALVAVRDLVADGRTVILYRAGRTPAGARASASHTASIAGDAVIVRALAAAAGAIVVDSIEAFDDLVRTFTLLRDRPVRGRRLAAVTNAGFECVAIGDHLGDLELVPFEGALRRRLAAILDEAGIGSVVDVHDPLDLTPMADDAVYERAVETILTAPGVDCGIVGIVPFTTALATLPAEERPGEDVADPAGIAARLVGLRDRTVVPWVAVVDAGPRYDPLVGLLEAGSIPTFRTVDAATRALGAYASVTARPGPARPGPDRLGPGRPAVDGSA